MLRRKIIFFIESLSGGGAEKVLTIILHHIDYLKYDITLLTLTNGGILEKDLDLKKVHYKTIISTKFSKIGIFWNKVLYNLFYKILPLSLLCRWFIPKNQDIYVAFVEGYSTKLLSFLPRTDKKIAWVHIDLKNYPWTQNKGIYKNLEEEKICYEKYNKIVCVSLSVEKVMKEYFQLSNVITIYNPIDSNGIIQMALEQSNIKISNGFNIVSVGRLVNQKGYDLLIPMISHMKKEGINANLYLLGEGCERAQLESLIEKNHISDFVHLLGYQKNPYSIMKDMDLFVCSSRSEGYSLVIAEAIVLGLPVVSMNCSGPNELLDGNKYGQLCDTYDELYQSIKKAVIDKLYLEDLKNRSKARKDFFEVRTILNQINQLFDEV